MSAKNQKFRLASGSTGGRTQRSIRQPVPDATGRRSTRSRAGFVAGQSPSPSSARPLMTTAYDRVTHHVRGCSSPMRGARARTAITFDNETDKAVGNCRFCATLTRCCAASERSPMARSSYAALQPATAARTSSAPKLRRQHRSERHARMSARQGAETSRGPQGATLRRVADARRVDCQGPHRPRSH
jgi:hypothetical protein